MSTPIIGKGDKVILHFQYHKYELLFNMCYQVVWQILLQSSQDHRIAAKKALHYMQGTN